MSPRFGLARNALIMAALMSLVTGCEGEGDGSDPLEGGGSDRPSATVAPSSGQGDKEPEGSEQGRTGAPSGRQPAGQALSRCHTDQLRGRLTALDPGAGNRYAALVLTNESDRTCRTYGWVGLQLATPGDRPVPTRVERAGKAGDVVIKPGASAWSRLRWGVVPTGGEPDDRPCRPAPTALLVIPPDETTQLNTEWRYGPVCDAGRITATPLAEGSGPTG